MLCFVFLTRHFLSYFCWSINKYLVCLHKKREPMIRRQQRRSNSVNASVVASTTCLTRYQTSKTIQVNLVPDSIKTGQKAQDRANRNCNVEVWCWATHVKAMSIKSPYRYSWMITILQTKSIEFVGFILHIFWKYDLNKGNCTGLYCQKGKNV